MAIPNHKAISVPGGDPAAPSIPAAEKGAANGVATLDDQGKVPTSQLPTDNHAEKVHITSNSNIKIEDGTLQVLNLTANSVLSCVLLEGQSVTVLVPPSAFTLNLNNFNNANNYVPDGTFATLVIMKANNTTHVYGVNQGR